jgi:lipoprotein NlpI
VLECHAGRLSVTELLHQAGPSRTKLCEAHFVIGLAALGRGNRAESKEQFTKCVATNVYNYAEYMWST